MGYVGVFRPAFLWECVTPSLTPLFSFARLLQCMQLVDWVEIKFFKLFS